MIKLFTGIPGCGKTYRAVYELQKESSKYYVFHNIDSLKMERFENGQFIKDFSKLDQDFISFSRLITNLRYALKSRKNMGGKY